MLNIAIPLAGSGVYFNSSDFIYPKPLLEVGNELLIKKVIDCYNTIPKKRFIFILNEDDCVRFHLDETIKHLTDSEVHIVYQQRETQGAICSLLLAIDYLDNNKELVIANGDQILQGSEIHKALVFFEQESVDAGVICFTSVHPKWSYALEDQATGVIIQFAEKRPISKNAIAGFYYFKKGEDFVLAAMESIRKDNRTNGRFYIAPAMNELILKNKKLKIFRIKKEKYHLIYSPDKLFEYRRSLGTVYNE